MGESTNSSITCSQIKGTCWSITLNNPTEQEIALWNNISKHAHFVKSAQGQLERGKEGTPHIQGMLRTDSVRFSAVKKLLPRAHIEKAKNALALAQYVTKEESREGQLQSSKRETQVASPEAIQKELYDSHLSFVCNYKVEPFWVGEKVKYKMVKRTSPFETSPVNFMKLLSEEHIWKSYFKDNTKTIMDTTFDVMIQKGFYGVEFISANNLTCGAFKKHLFSIIYRHAFHQVKAQNVSSQREEDID